MTIKTADITDYQKVRELVEELENQTFNNDDLKKIFESGLKNPDIEYYLVEIENEAVAFFSLATLYQLHHAAKVVEVQELVVKGPYRKKSIGSNIIKFCTDKAREKGAQNLELSSNMKRTHAHAFYLRNGFSKLHFRFVMKLT
jgi:PhnO protein